MQSKGRILLFAGTCFDWQAKNKIVWQLWKSKLKVRKNSKEDGSEDSLLYCQINYTSREKWYRLIW